MVWPRVAVLPALCLKHTGSSGCPAPETALCRSHQPLPGKVPTLPLNSSLAAWPPSPGLPGRHGEGEAGPQTSAAGTCFPCAPALRGCS